jgi:uncharacterized protein
MRLMIVAMIVLIGLGGVGPVRADFEAGQKAAEIGDYETAVREWLPLVEQRHAGALMGIGYMYWIGGGVSKDRREAINWFRRAAELGHAPGQHSLGLAYLTGEDIPQDYKKAEMWLRSAAEQGEARSQYSLGYMLRAGSGVLQDYKEAVKWFRRAAEQGDTLAQTSLGAMHFDGNGVQQDYVQAHMWSNIAGAGGNKEGAKIRAIVEKIMTPAQVAEAQKLARECMEKKYKGCGR